MPPAIELMKNQIIRTLVLQYGLAVVYLAVVTLWDLAVTASALLGCLAALVPKTYFSFRMLQVADNDDAAQWLSYVYRSEIGKWVIMAGIFATAFTSGYTWDPVIVFAGFILVQTSGWFAPMVTKGN